jgi:hypothetical protein
MKKATIEIRHLIPDEGKAIHKIDTDDYYFRPGGVYIGKDEPESNYVEVDMSEVPEEKRPDYKPLEPEEESGAEQ